MNSILPKLYGGLIVSCQSEGHDPFNEDAAYMALFAQAAQMGGACAIRSEGLNKIKAIKRSVNLPIIGLIKTNFDDGTVRITGSFNEVEQLITVGCDIIAIDGTFRERDGGYSGPDFIRIVKQRYGCTVLADIATLDEAQACEKGGADSISTTLSGYTPETLHLNNGTPDFELLQQTVKQLSIPVIAEGRFNTPELARQAIEMGAHAVTVGSAITRPRVITSWFVSQMQSKHQSI